MTSLAHALRDRFRLLSLIEGMLDRITSIAERMRASLDEGGKIVWMGNGGSASHAQHMASEFVGRFARERAGLPSLSLTADTAVLTAVANDYGYQHVFSRQIEALCGRRDVVVGFSTSGRSPNVIEGLRAGRAIGAYTVVLTGAEGGSLSVLCDECLVVPSVDAACLQEVHLVIAHLFCVVLDAEKARP